ncbi:thioesterase II family protein [Streptomonospora nanhaiensis]|uniref:Medium-chain acyl-[acyl-carrier-protein] hydrolase n=1 Tax=Streptomonospora nanhaiensis TaxID=1323731 RepID=A0A853BJ27_9ACTN|nr:alpha/beta fold hydrolase [Streptomonospora nanhaiensis]MBX9391748.1 alpha/beta fold hydrolase [Streptomonospora nanhaiensis]NYI95273.1 medium-chain acyl-[acyl-carrier-protein] hydrolase [Streptomonospora nanhaiensis]
MTIASAPRKTAALLRTRPAVLRAAAPQPAATVRLVCFPHSGGGPAAYHRWAAALAPDIEVWPVTLPGRAGRAREPLAGAWGPLVEEATAAVLEEVPGPVALFGHSLGAALAFEVARAMTRAGEPPVHLLVSARTAPQQPRFRIDLPAGNAELLDAVDRAYAGVPAAVRDSAELRDHFTPILRADLELSNSYTYRPGPALPCPITALGGETDATVSAADLAGWGDHTRAGFEAHLFPGGHFYLENAPARVLDTVWRSVVRPA